MWLQPLSLICSQAYLSQAAHVATAVNPSALDYPLSLVCSQTYLSQAAHVAAAAFSRM
jgi:hypothetical protein